MSSLFNKTTGINLSSVLGTNSNSSTATISNSSKPPKTFLLPKANLSNGASLAPAVANPPVKQFADKLKLQQYQYALNANNYLKTIDNCLEEASRTGDLLLTGKSLIEFPSTIAFKYDLTDTLTVGKF